MRTSTMCAKPDRLLDPSKLPGRPVAPSFMAFCQCCGETTHHAGLCGKQGEELGAACLWCGTMTDPRRV